jgi:hypothetical protein
MPFPSLSIETMVWGRETSKARETLQTGAFGKMNQTYKIGASMVKAAIIDNKVKLSQLQPR